MGCRDCVNMYKSFGEAQCRIEPNEYQTADQKSVCAWLSRAYAAGDSSWTLDGCPKYEKYVGVKAYNFPLRIFKQFER